MSRSRRGLAPARPARAGGRGALRPPADDGADLAGAAVLGRRRRADLDPTRKHILGSLSRTWNFDLTRNAVTRIDELLIRDPDLYFGSFTEVLPESVTLNRNARARTRDSAVPAHRGSLAKICKFDTDLPIGTATVTLSAATRPAPGDSDIRRGSQTPGCWVSVCSDSDLWLGPAGRNRQCDPNRRALRANCDPSESHGRPPHDPAAAAAADPEAGLVGGDVERDGGRSGGRDGRRCCGTRWRARCGGARRRCGS
jgi:hypothetical protein